jgi:hypothetical protein
LVSFRPVIAEGLVNIASWLWEQIMPDRLEIPVPLWSFRYAWFGLDAIDSAQ